MQHASIWNFYNFCETVAFKIFTENLKQTIKNEMFCFTLTYPVGVAKLHTISLTQEKRHSMSDLACLKGYGKMGNVGKNVLFNL